MKARIFVSIAFVIVFLCGLNISYGQKTNLLKEKNIPVNYASIAGFWESTPETSVQLNWGTLVPAIKIEKQLPDKWKAQGVFLWKEGFREYWPLSVFLYNEKNDSICFTDRDGSRYKGIVDEKKQKITGKIYSEGDPVEQLDFVRAKNRNIDRIFVPRFPGKDAGVCYQYQIPDAKMDGLQSQSIYSFINDSILFNNLMKQIIDQKFGRLESVLLVKNNKLLLEEYFFDYKPNELHNFFSCTKSIVSILVGAALSESEKMDVEQSVVTFFPDSVKGNTGKDKLKLKHVLTMTAGLEEVDKFNFESEDELIKQILRQPQETEPGKKFRYNSECPYLLGGIIYYLTGKQADDFAREKLFEPLGITHYNWTTNNKIADCHSHLHMQPRDMLKIGMLVLNKGRWKNQQIIPEKWIKESTKAQVAETEFFDYGYQWWHRSSQNKSWWETSDEIKKYDIAAALGYGGQFIFIVEDLDLVMVCTSSDYNESNGFWLKKVELISDHIIPLFED